MAQRVQRTFAVVIAVLFLVSSVGFSGIVIWQMYQDGKDAPEAKTASDAAETETDPSAQSTNSSQGKDMQDFKPLDKVDSLQIIDQVVGTGAEAKAGATVTAHYTGATAKNGKIFESSKDAGQPATFSLAQVIEGWQKGVPGMKVGGKRRLVIPAAQAYGDQSPSEQIPANSDLVFDIELVNVQ